ncbi:MAG: glycosyltransferase [Acidobacteriia bacterium]|nr:glycosyltransferase [Terriglobia bacterium]
MDQVVERVSVIVPCFNEGDRIRKNLCEICDFLAAFAPDYELIAVDDGSSDDTRAEIQAASAAYPAIRPVYYDENIGKGYALREGFERATGRYVIFLDADLDLPPRQIALFFEIMRRENADVVIGNKRHPASRVEYPRRRAIISWIYSVSLRLLFHLPLHDTQAGLKLFKSEVLEKVFPKIVCKRFAFDVELLANVHRLGYKILEAPIELNFSRVLRLGRLTLGDLWKTGWDTLAIFYRLRVVRYYDREHLTPREFPRISIVITARGEEATLEECLERCLTQTYPAGFEVILVANHKGNIVQRPPLKVIETGDQRLSEKRDSGRKLAQYEIIAFLDGSVVPARNWMARAARNFGDPQIAAVSGPRLNSPQVDLPRQPVWRWVGTLLGSDSLRYRYISKAPRAGGDGMGNNLFVRRVVLDQIVNDSAPPECFEGSALAWTITRRLKQIIAYDPEVIVYRSAG